MVSSGNWFFTNHDRLTWNQHSRSNGKFSHMDDDVLLFDCLNETPYYIENNNNNLETVLIV